MCWTLILNSVLSTYAAAISILQFRKSKRNVVDPEKSASDPGKSSDSEGVALTLVAK
jgi:hypothetical protein